MPNRSLDQDRTQRGPRHRPYGGPIGRMNAAICDADSLRIREPAHCHHGACRSCTTNNLIQADHGRLKSPLRQIRGLKRLRSARIMSAEHALMKNLHRGHYELGMDVDRRGDAQAARCCPDTRSSTLRSSA